MAAAVGVALLVLALACAWRYTSLHDLLDPPRLLALGRQLRELPFAALWTLAAFVVGGLLVVPLVALVAVTGLVWGLVPGMLLALAGSLLSAALTYSIGRRVSGDLVERHAGPRLQALRRQLVRGGWWGVALVRLLPLAPYSVMNLLFGALRVRARDFLVGTAAGLAPGIVLTVAFAQSLAQVLHRPGASSVAMVGLALLALVGLGIATRRFVRQREATSSAPGSAAPESATPLDARTLPTAATSSKSGSVPEPGLEEPAVRHHPVIRPSAHQADGTPVDLPRSELP